MRGGILTVSLMIGLGAGAAVAAPALPVAAGAGAVGRQAAPAPRRAQPGAPAFRRVGKGERRVEGLLQRIVCSRRGVEFVVKLPDRVARFQAAALDGVEFISYRKDIGADVQCGGRTPADRVYVTARDGALDGTAVAVEFLPAGGGRRGGGDG